MPLSQLFLSIKIHETPKRYLDGEADPMFIAKAGKFIKLPAMGTTA